MSKQVMIREYRGSYTDAYALINEIEDKYNELGVIKRYKNEWMVVFYLNKKEAKKWKK